MGTLWQAMLSSPFGEQMGKPVDEAVAEAVEVVFESPPTIRERVELLIVVTLDKSTPSAIALILALPDEETVRLA